MKMLPNVFNTERFATVIEEPRLLCKSELEPMYAQSEIKYSETPSDSIRA